MRRSWFDQLTTSVYTSIATHPLQRFRLRRSTSVRCQRLIRPRNHESPKHLRPLISCFRVLVANRTSGSSSPKQYRLPERGARIARREKRAYWAYVSDEQRREAGCPARQAVVLQRGRATSRPSTLTPDPICSLPSVFTCTWATGFSPSPARPEGRPLHPSKSAPSIET